ncbi:MAG: Magnesium transporter MgtE [Alphaproteobacteria bacterium MarineAlpha3_Bin2]|nr:MAG: Magnesium transporter MgtE [Alphaproteobacteria bacterium MarineAlpha3_Bin2]
MDNEDIPSEEQVHDLEAGAEQVFLNVLVSGDEAGVRTLMGELHPADAADLLERLGADERARVVEILRSDFDSEILSELDETVRDHVVECLGVENVAAFIVGMDSDDALEVVEELDEDEQQQVLDAIPVGDRTLIEEGLSYPEDSAGRLMQREVVTIPTFWNVGETIDFLRKSADRDDGEGENELPTQFYDLFVVDPSHKPVGTIPLSRILRTRRPVSVTDIMETEMKLLPVTTDQEDVAFVFRQRDLVSAPVVDDGGRLVGAVTIDDVVDVIDEEHEEDIMFLGGVKEDDLYDATLDTTRARFMWLLINLGTAILASIVIGLFDATLEQMVALAVLMPIVASMGGNAGTQSLTVAVRALAMKELTSTNAVRVIGKEALVGVFNGVLFAVLIGIVVWLWFGSVGLGVVIGLAMIVNMFVAGLAGTTIPLALDRMGIDPAVASSVFLTTLTDVVGFFVFLGLAALLLF